jgi:multidrug efflux pump
VTNFLKKRRWAFVILFVSGGAIFFFGSQLKSELSPLEDRNWLRMLVTMPEGTSFEATDATMDKISTFVG